jgi:hypothetical protein
MHMNLNRAQGAPIGWMSAILGGVGLGAALMYLFDPERGRGRRAKLSDQVASKANRIGAGIGSKTRDLRNRAQGLVHEVKSALPSSEKGSQSSEGGLGQTTPRATGLGGERW